MGTTDKSVQEQDPGLSAASPVPGSRWLPWSILSLFQFGLILGLGSLWWQLRPSTDLPQEEASSARAPAAFSPTGPEPAHPPAGTLSPESLARAESLLREGRFDESLAIYQQAGDAETAQLSPASRYRLALCLEALGRYDQGLGAYKNIVEQQQSTLLAAAAQLGQARIYLRLKRPAEAKDLLWDLLLKSASPRLRDQPLLADVRYLLALAYSADASAVRTTDVRMFSFQMEDWTVDRFLDALAAPDDVKASAVLEERFEVTRFGRREDDILVSATVAKADVIDLLNRLARQAGLQIEWTPRVRRQLGGRISAISVDAFPLVDLLSGLGERFGLICQLRNNCARFSCDEDNSPAELAQYRAVMAKRRLREAVVAHPSHPLASAAYLELGNTECANGNLHEAIAWYERIAREFPQSVVGLQAHYNLGFVQSALGDLDAARSAFYWVADQAPGHALASAAYLKIGKLYLEGDDPEQAIRPLRRAVGSATALPDQPAAVLMLAAAYLLTGNPRAANAALVEARTLIAQDAYRPMAAFLDSLARYRAVGDRRLVEREAGELLAALLLVHDDHSLEPFGSLLMGEAYLELGMGEQMAEIYEKALPAARGHAAAQMAYALAEYAVAQENRERARQLFESVAAAGNAKWTPRAQQRLAEMALDDKKPDQCLELCTYLLIDKDPANKAVALRLMGRAFEQRGDHRQAARCFAGLLPEP